MDQHGKAKKSGKARIPDHLRRRALVSCDRCKKRRIRCSRASGSDQNEPCQSCLEVGVQCESTLPRKTRIYGSVETLSVRYRVLDALIKGLYPDKDTNNIDTLYAIAETHDIAIPQFDEQTVAEEVFSQPPPKAASSPQLSPGSTGSPSTTSRDSESLHPDGKQAKVVEEKLVPMPQGPSHYIGPSSSFGFVLTVRNMVAEFNAALRTIQPEDERSKLSSDFAASNWSKALEPIVKEESEDSSEDNIDRSLGEPSGRTPIRKPRAQSLFPPSGDSTALSNRSKRITFLSLLPTKEVTDTFVVAYFDRVHPNYLMFHRPTFQMRYEMMWSQPHVLMRDIEPGWVCCIFMIIVFGAQALEDRDAKQSMQIQRHYLDLVQARMHSLISATTLINVQALLLLQLYQHNCTERNSAFMLLGCASRMAMALGMHREGTSGGFDETEREVRRRVWWTAYMFEQNQCAILGRPCAIDDWEVNVGFPDEMMLDQGQSVPIGYTEHSVRLMKLLAEVRRKIYSAQSGSTQRGEHAKVAIAVQLLLDLDSWHHSLPSTIRLEFASQAPQHRRAIILLHVQFHNTQALVTRPFILRKVGVQLARKLGRHVRSQDLDKEELKLSYACGTSSKKAALLLHQLLASNTFDGVQWMDAYYIYHAVFILSLDFLARPWEEQDTQEDYSRKQTIRDVVALLQKVKLCPTFTVLTNVSWQLAKIVGIFDTQPSQQERPDEYRQYMEQHHQGPIHFDYGAQTLQGNSGNVLQSWFQKDHNHVELPWEFKDFFGTDTYVGPNQIQPEPGYPVVPMALGGASMGGNFQHQIPSAIEGEDLMAPIPPHTAYTHWGTIDTPFAQHRQNMPKPPMNPMGQ